MYHIHGSACRIATNTRKISSPKDNSMLQQRVTSQTRSCSQKGLDFDETSRCARRGIGAGG